MIKKSASIARSANIPTIKLQIAIIITSINQSISQNNIMSSRSRQYPNSQQQIKFMYVRESERRAKIYDLLFNRLSAINLNREQRYKDNYSIRISNETELDHLSMRYQYLTKVRWAIAKLHRSHP